MSSDFIDDVHIAEISEALTGARKAAVGLPEFPGKMPSTLDGAYAVQRRSVNLWPDEVGGWKVGGVPADYIERFNEARLVGPIFKRKIFSADIGEKTTVAAFPGFAAVEGEWVFRMGDTPAGDTLHIGIEIASSPLLAINDMGPVAVVCDFGNNNGLVVGPEIENWRDIDAGTIELETRIGNDIVGRRDVNNFPRDGLNALAFLRRHAAKHRFALPAGTYCASGAITGVHETQVGDHAVCTFGQFGSLGVRFAAAVPEPA